VYDICKADRDLVDYKNDDVDNVCNRAFGNVQDILNKNVFDGGHDIVQDIMYKIVFDIVHNIVYDIVNGTPC